MPQDHRIHASWRNLERAAAARLLSHPVADPYSRSAPVRAHAQMTERDEVQPGPTEPSRVLMDSYPLVDTLLRLLSRRIVVALPEHVAEHAQGNQRGGEAPE